MQIIQDPYFTVDLVSASANPQKVCYLAAHQDYSEKYVQDEFFGTLKGFDTVGSWGEWECDYGPNDDVWIDPFNSGELDETTAGKRLIQHCVKYRHWGVLEHPQLVISAGYFPHEVMQQLRTHRITSFDVQCLGGDTEITFVDTNGHSTRKLRKTISELYDLWTNGEKAVRERKVRGRKGEAPGFYRRDAKTRLKKMNLRVLNEDTGLFEVSHIKEVTSSGEQPLYRLTFEDGKTLDCTTNHRLLTNNGWKTMQEATNLQVDSESKVISFSKESYIMSNGTIVGEGLYRNKEWLEYHLSKGLHTDQIAEIAGCSVETIKKWVYKHGLELNKKDTTFKKGQTPWNKDKGGYSLNLTEESKEKRRLNAIKYTKRGSDSIFWKGGTTTDRQLIGAWTRNIAPKVHEKFNYICQSCFTRGNKLHAHHLVPVYADVSLAYEFDNLVTLCKACHEKIHFENRELEFAKNYTPTLEVSSWANKPKAPGNFLVSHPLKVVGIEYLGVQMTYDIEVEDPWHNFVANGLVVHNSGRYTGQRICQLSRGEIPESEIEKIFYLRPLGFYTDRQGSKYEYTEAHRKEDLDFLWCMSNAYRNRIDQGFSEEHARQIYSDYALRQHFVMSANLRSWLHVISVRHKEDVQLETKTFAVKVWKIIKDWVPEVAAYFEEKHLNKNQLMP